MRRVEARAASEGKCSVIQIGKGRSGSAECFRGNRWREEELKNAGLACVKIARELHAAFERDGRKVRAPKQLPIGPSSYAGRHRPGSKPDPAEKRAVRTHRTNFQPVRIVLRAKMNELQETGEVVDSKIAAAHARHFTDARGEFRLSEGCYHGVAVGRQELDESCYRDDANESGNHWDVTNMRPASSRAPSGTRTNV